MKTGIDALPNNRGRVVPGYLYVFEFKDGRTKIGMSWKPRNRAKEVSRSFRADIVKAHAEPFFSHWLRQAEMAALKRARVVSVPAEGSTELFFGLKFGTAKTLIRQMCAREYKPLAETVERMEIHIKAARRTVVRAQKEAS